MGMEKVGSLWKQKDPAKKKSTPLTGQVDPQFCGDLRQGARLILKENTYKSKETHPDYVLLAVWDDEQAPDPRDTQTQPLADAYQGRPPKNTQNPAFKKAARPHAEDHHDEIPF